jgi:simple sugar transport system ATP-binding protein
MKAADAIVYEELGKIGINVRDPQQAVGTLSGGERQCVAIARAVYHGARVLILDEPTSALGVHQASIVLRYVAQARQRGLAVIFITHNIHHAYPIGDVFTMLNRGRSLGTFRRSEITEKEVLDMMAGGREIRELQQELERFTKPGSGTEATIS